MSSRERYKIAPPHFTPQDNASYRFKITLGMGRPMSALGQKQTYAVHQPMSALPPIATAKADLSQTAMSALPPKADMCSATRDVRFGPKADIRFYRSERAYSGARLLRSGMSEILIRPLNGSFSSKIK